MLRARGVAHPRTKVLIPGMVPYAELSENRFASQICGLYLGGSPFRNIAKLLNWLEI